MTANLTNIMMLAKEVGKDTVEIIKDNPDKVYFPFFGDSENILNSGISIDRIFFTIPGINFAVYWYGFLIALGLALALIYGYKKMVPYGLDPDKMTDAIVSGFIGALFCARLYYVIFNDTGVGLKDFFDTRSGGLAIYGGLIGAVVFGGLMVKIRRLKLATALDIAGPCFLIGQCIGRWGNFFNQEAFGTNTDLPWGMMSTSTIDYVANIRDEYAIKSGEILNYYMPVHPCFLYESLWCLIGFIALHLYSKHRKFDGEVFLMYIGWYGLGRFFIEGLRTDSLYLGQIRVSQLVAGTCVLAALVLIVIFRGMVKRAGGKKLYCETEESQVQLAGYRLYTQYGIDKKALKKKINEAKAQGNDFSAMQKEYDEKYGAEGKKKLEDEVTALEAKAKEFYKKKSKETEISDKDSDYKSIVDDSEDVAENNAEVEEAIEDAAAEVVEEIAEETTEDATENENTEDENNG